MGRRKLRDERGASALEFAMVSIPLLWLVFGIISFGMMLSFRQTLSQATTEGARAAAVVGTAADPASAATAAVNSALGAVKKSCSSEGMTCDTSKVSAPFSCGATAQCVTVSVTYGYRAHPVIPSLPLVGLALPAEMTYSATVRVQ